MLQLEDVSKTYERRGKPVIALDHATLEIPNGDFLAVVGQSGSGKSTLLLILGGMLSPTSGRVLLDGKSLYELSPDVRARLRKTKIGFVFQTFNLIPYLTALENVQVPLLLAGADESKQAERAASLLDSVGLSDRLDHKPTELSVGQQPRVALARMLANDPDCILADEPTGNLDPETGDRMIDYFQQFNREGRTIVLVTHNPQSARRAKRQLKLINGRIMEPSVV